MELFTIQCTTCRARLKVNDASVIGDILACPKCHSMVLVVPPPDWQDPNAPVGENRAAAETPAPPVKPETKKVAAVPPLLPQRSAPTTSAAKTANVPPLPNAKAATTIAAPVAPTLVANAQIAVATTTTPAAPTQLSALAARLPRDWKLLGGGLAAGVALGLGAWLAIVLLTRAPEAPTVAQAPSNAPTEAAPQSPRASVAPASEAIEETVVADESNEITEQAQPKPSATAAGGTTNVAEPVAPPSEEKQSGPEPAPRETTSTPPARIKLEPAEREPVAPQEPPKSSVAVVDDAALPSDAPAQPPTKEPVNSEESSGALTAHALTSDEIDERLSGPLPKVRFVKVPLAQFIEFINEFSGLSIVIDERALAKVSKNRQTPVTVKLADTTARDALRSAVNSLGLTCVVRDGQLIVTAVSK